ncbi:uncharacterized protein BDR25DRAFT_245562 [Lindgomyces ingoldianus]|uniref:Uncharacterized protein n=1 Tax=Lindgomyces ingoldianus TaxID=673940 RepID=A0ACB6QBE8_9PLEO|nr:uncharacterized protein BDR25DRAFT_245562 [Lindgomyces ingoldianus]KAF2463476.1 hypothetical protein BDR25DRAFT_245562 [Lindgomyces ingoldianus]
MASPSGNRVIAVTEAFTVVAGAVVFLRLFTRVAVLRNAGFEDVCITVAMACSIGLTVTIAEQVRNGMGMHITTLTPTMIIDSQKAFWASIWIYNLSLTFTKLSILVQFLRIFPTRRFRFICFILAGFIGTFGIWTFFGSIFLCSPIEFFWDKTTKGGTCLNQFVIWYLNAGVNIVQDFAILILPIPVLRTLNIPKGQKRALIIIFALGGFVCLISIIRLQTLVRISNSKDPTFDNPPAATFSVVEVNVGIVCACLPSLRPLFAHMLPSYFPPIPQLNTSRRNDEERQQPKHLRTLSSQTHPYTAGESSRPSYSRGGATNTTWSRNESELEQMYNHQATVLGTGTRINGPVRQVTINHTPRISSSHPAPRLPRLPENLATIGSVGASRPSSKHSRRSSGPRNHSRKHHARNSSLHKPLPITPFPVLEPWNR